MARRAIGGVITAIVLALLPISGGAQMTPTTIDLSGAAVGALPAEFTTGLTGQGGPVRWAVVDDASAVSGRALAQSSTDTTDYRFPLAIYQGVSAKDLEVTLRFKPVAGKVDQAGGIAIRLASPDDYYVVRANALEDNVRFYRVVKGRRQQLAGINTKVASGQWHRLAIRAEGNRFTVTFDGTHTFSATDDTFAGAGKVALWTKADSVTHFAEITLKPL
jgi:hypothetical protein